MCCAAHSRFFIASSSFSLCLQIFQFSVGSLIFWSPWILLDFLTEFFGIVICWYVLKINYVPLMIEDSGWSRKSARNLFDNYSFLFVCFFQTFFLKLPDLLLLEIILLRPQTWQVQPEEVQVQEWIQLERCMKPRSKIWILRLWKWN